VPSSQVGVDSDYGVRAAANAAATEGLYQHQQWIVRQILPDTADSDYLERWALIWGITRKVASVASGTIVFSGTSGAAIPQGTRASTSVGVAYQTSAAAVIAANGTAIVASVAVLSGASGNTPAGTALTLSAAPAGVQSQAVSGTFSGGADAELDDSLLARLLDRIQHAPAGGNKYDFKRWAKEVSGVDEAWVFPLRRGLGSVDIVVMATGGAPSAALIAEVKAHIDDQRPVTASDCAVLGPTLTPVPIIITGLVLDGTTLDSATAEINTRQAAYFATLVPGGTAYRNKIASMISDIQGVVDFVLASPATNVTSAVDATHVQLLTLGGVAIS